MYDHATVFVFPATAAPDTDAKISAVSWSTNSTTPDEEQLTKNPASADAGKVHELTYSAILSTSAGASKTRHPETIFPAVRLLFKNWMEPTDEPLVGP